MIAVTAPRFDVKVRPFGGGGGGGGKDAGGTEGGSGGSDASVQLS